MLGINKKKKSNATASTHQNNHLPGSSNVCVIAEGTKIEGNFKSVEDVRLDGIIIGDLTCEKKIVMGPNSRIEGNVSCSESVIRGKIEGKLIVKGTLHLLENAYVNGKIKAKKLIVEEGAAYNGECIIGEMMTLAATN
ncbi:MAG: polymer-forming cytoskeletal protein [Saprospiraceae bacterium]